MGVEARACFVLVCDCGEDCDPFADECLGGPHFPSAEAALLAAADAGWVVTGTRVLAPHCAARTECALVGHDVADWADGDDGGIRYRVRWCWVCGAEERVPSVWEAELLRHAAREVGDLPPC